MLKLSLLDSPKISLNGKSLSEQITGKAFALLIYLAVTGKVKPRDVLTDLLWSDIPTSQARKNLRTLLYEVRKPLEAYLIVTRQSIAFNQQSPYWLDVEVFRTNLSPNQLNPKPQILDVVLDLYQGEFLHGFYPHNIPVFEAWVCQQREQLHQLAANGLQRLAAQYLQQSKFQAALTANARLLNLEPENEEAHRQRMFILAANGHRTAALDQYHRCQRMLSAEFDTIPVAETRTLYEEIKAGKFDKASLESTLTVSPQPLLSRLGQSDLSSHLPPIFVGCEQEMVQLETFLQTMLAGHGQVVFINGEAGSGKTALITEFARRAHAIVPDLVVASSRCTQLTTSDNLLLPFCELLALLIGLSEAGYVGEGRTAENIQRLRGVSAIALEILNSQGPDLIPQFISSTGLLTRLKTLRAEPTPWRHELETLATRKATSAGEVAAPQSTLFQQLTNVLNTLASQRPLLLVLDDLQWADAASLSLLVHLGSRLLQSRILIVGLYRSEDLAVDDAGKQHPLTSIVHNLQRYNGDIQIKLDHTQPQERWQFVNDLLDAQPNQFDHQFRQTLFQCTRGQPLFTVELLRHLPLEATRLQETTMHWFSDQQKLPASIQGMIAQRIHQLPTALREILMIASLAGESFILEAVARVQGVATGWLISRLSHALDRQYHLISAQDCQSIGQQRLTQYRFQHPLVQQYLYYSLDEVERQYWHEELGNALEELYGEQRHQVAAQIARHFSSAGRPEKAAPYLPLIEHPTRASQNLLLTEMPPMPLVAHFPLRSSLSGPITEVGKR